MNSSGSRTALVTIAVLGVLAGIVLGIMAIVNAQAANNYLSLDNVVAASATVAALWGWASFTFGLGVLSILLLLAADVVVSSLKSPPASDMAPVAEVAPPVITE